MCCSLHRHVLTICAILATIWIDPEPNMYARCQTTASIFCLNFQQASSIALLALSMCARHGAGFHHVQVEQKAALPWHAMSCNRRA